MERKLFSWQEWDLLDVCSLQFYDCVLKQDIGKYKVGDRFDCIVFDYNRGFIELYLHEVPTDRFDIEIKLV